MLKVKKLKRIISDTDEHIKEIAQEIAEEMLLNSKYKDKKEWYILPRDNS